jgi:hypothetical protein
MRRVPSPQESELPVGGGVVPLSLLFPQAGNSISAAIEAANKCL